MHAFSRSEDPRRGGCCVKCNRPEGAPDHAEVLAPPLAGLFPPHGLRQRTNVLTVGDRVCARQDAGVWSDAEVLSVDGGQVGVNLPGVGRIRVPFGSVR